MTHVLGKEKLVGDVRISVRDGVRVVDETYEYDIFADNREADRADIINNTPGLPIPNITQSPSGLGICQTVDIRRHPQRAAYWTATVAYSTQVIQIDGNDPGQPPDQWQPVRETFLEPFEEVEIVDQDGKPYTNGAGVPYAQAPSVPRDNLRWDFSQFEPLAITDEVIAARNNTINSAIFLGYPVHTLLLKIRRSTVGFFYGYSLRLTDYSIVWNKRDWNQKLPNWGNSFVKDGKEWPYKFYKAGTPPQEREIHSGPLGSRNVPVDTDFIAADGLPTGGTEEHDGWTYAIKPAAPILYYINRRRFEELDFNSFLRVQ